MYVLWLLLLPTHTLMPVMVFLEADTKEFLFLGSLPQLLYVYGHFVFGQPPYFIKLVNVMSLIFNTANFVNSVKVKLLVS